MNDLNPLNNDVENSYLNKINLVYPLVVVTSLAIGAYEAVKDTGGVFRLVQIGVPFLSAYLGARTELEKAYGLGLNFGIVDMVEEKGFNAAFITGVSGVAGGILSCLSQGAGFGFTKGLVSLFS